MSFADLKSPTDRRIVAARASNFEAKAANFGRSNLNQTPADADKNGGANLSSAANFSAQNASNLSAVNFDPNFLIKLANLVAKYGLNDQKTAQNEVLDVATGKLTLEQINLIYKHMPVDLSFVDENEIVKFYTDTKHRVFPRSAGVIGRDVKNCHPRESVASVLEIIDAFCKGERDKIDFWLELHGKFIYIYYVAVRDENGVFKGVLEMMQDVTRIRSLEGKRTLVTWDDLKKKYGE